jgi:drug/metabolite transporter (DMT)-like permease
VGGVWNSALALLLVTGVLLGLTPPFGKLASANGIPPLLWALVISLGAGLILLTASMWRGNKLPLDQRHLRYFFIVATVSYALPNFLMFSAIPHLGAGYATIMFTLSPIVTLLLSFSLRVSRPSRLSALGVMIGFIGALMVAATRGQAGRPADLVWVLAGLMIPVSLAAGNIYRTADWPKGTRPLELAAGSHLAAAAMLIVLVLSYEGAGPIGLLSEVPFLVAAQVAASSAMFAFFFRLQQVGGPVYLSQIGYVAAAVGLIVGVVFLGERYALMTWLGAAIITLGVSITTKAQRPG